MFDGFSIRDVLARRMSRGLHRKRTSSKSSVVGSISQARLEDRVVPANIILDDFSAPNPLVSISDAAPPVQSKTGSKTDAGILGGQRDYFIVKESGNQDRLVTFNTNAGSGTFSTDNGAKGNIQLIYDGPTTGTVSGSPPVYNPVVNGLALNLSNQSEFIVQIEADLTATQLGDIFITVYSNNGANVFSVSQDIPASAVSGTKLTFPFSSFTGVNFANVGAIVVGTKNLEVAGDVTFNTIIIGAVADLSLVKEGPTGTVAVGDLITYTITVSNAGPNPATAVTVSDQLPSGVQFVSANTNGNGVFNSLTGIWTLTNPINKGGTAKLEIQARVVAAGTIRNYAQVASMDGRDPDSTPGNNSGRGQSGDPPSEDDNGEHTFVSKAVDFGDAPDSYGTTIVANGARHIATGIQLGSTRDTELDGQPNAAANGDGADEDGITTLTYYRGSTVNLPVVTSNGSGFLNAWFDLNKNGIFEDSERLLTNVAVSNGTNNIPLSIPGSAALGSTYARFRVSNTSQGATPSSIGRYDSGEVEDYLITIAEPIDLSLVKTVSNANPAVGDIVTFTLTVTNAGPNTATGVTVSDPPTAGLTFIAQTGGTGTYDGTTWTIPGSIPSGGSVSVTYTARVTSASALTNYAQIQTHDQGDSDSQPGNGNPPTPVQDDEAAVTLTPQPVDFGDAPTKAQSGFAGDYPTTIANNGARHIAIGPTLGATRDTELDGQPNAAATGDGSDEDGVTITNLIPGTAVPITVNASAAGFVSAWVDFNRDGDWDDAGEQILTNVPVSAGNNTFNITAPLSASLGDTYARFRITQASHSGLQPTGLAPTGEVEDYRISVREVADLELIKLISGPSTLNLGDTITFSITVGNSPTSLHAATGVTVTDTLPSGLTGITQTGGPGSISVSGNILTWTGLGTIPIGGTVTLTFTAVVTESGSFTNYAQIATSNQFDPDSKTGNNSGRGQPGDPPSEDDDDVAPYTVRAFDFGDAPDTYGTLLASNGARHVATGPTLGPTRDTENNGQPNVAATGDGSDEDGVTMTDITGDGIPDFAPGATTNVTVNAPAGGFLNVWYDINKNGVFEAGEQVVTNKSLSAGSNTIPITLPAGATLGTTYMRYRITSASVASPSPLGLLPDGEVEDYRVETRNIADLRLVKGVDNTSPNIGDTVTYTITVTNDGPNVATGVTVRDIFPSGLTNFTYVSGPGGAGSFNVGASFITWTIPGSIGVGAANAVTLTYTAVVTASGNHTNTARVQTANEADPDSTPGNDNPAEDDQSSITIVTAGLDFGDAPDTYGTLLASNGARHVATGPTLGPTRDTENNGQPNVAATGDGSDEDGVTMTDITGDGIPDFAPGATTNVTVNAPAGGFLNVWYDINRNGVFEAGEQVVTNKSLSAGSNTIPITLPAGATLGTTYMRYRITSASVASPSPLGLLPDGEVEDYRVETRNIADLSIVKGINNTTPAIGETVTFTITVTNAGPNVATGVTVRDQLPAGLSSITQTGGPGSIGVSGSVLTWTIPGSIGVGAANAVTLTFTAVITQSGSFRNYAQVQTANEADPDSQPGNGNPANPPVQDDEADVSYTVAAVDFGDAPASYGTLIADNGARHVAVGIRLGATRDTENDGQPNATATGDGSDEDGVTIPALTSGVPATITVTVDKTGFLNAWFDWNANGTFDPGEQVFTNKAVVAGTQNLTVNVPFTAVPGFTFARFRVTDASVSTPSPIGLLPSGEVEDYRVSVTANFDFGDAPDSYGTKLASNGAAHVLVTGGPVLGSTVDQEDDGQPATFGSPADGDNNKGINDENGVVFDTLTPGTTAVVSVFSNTGGLLNAWIDWNRNGTFEAGEQITPAAGKMLSKGNNLLFVPVPLSAGAGLSYARFRISSAGNLGPTGFAPDGEVEDYEVTIPEVLVNLGNRVFFDTDGDGVQDIGEPGIPGATIQVIWFGPDGVLGGSDDKTFTTTTGTDGLWSVSSVPLGNYRITATAPTGKGLVLTDSIDNGTLSATNPVTISITSGGDRMDIDFGFRGTLSLGDRVWYDVDNDGVQDANEPGIGGVQVTALYAGIDDIFGTADDFTFTTTTAAATGVYGFSNLPIGSYKVSTAVGSLPNGLKTATFDLDSGTTSPDSVVTLTGPTELTTSRKDVDFGYRGTGSIGDRLFVDVDGDGIQDPGEPGIVGVTVNLVWGGQDGDINTPADNLILTTVTGADGIYTFPNLAPGSYKVSVDPTTLPLGSKQTFDPDGTLDNTHTLTLGVGEVRSDVDFGYKGLSSISGFVYHDADRNGSFDAGETPLAGVTLNLTGTNNLGQPVSLTATTDATGAYKFINLLPSDANGYTVTQVQPTAYADGLDKVGSIGGTLGNDIISKIVLPVLTDAVNYNFGENLPTISGFSWEDINRNGVREPGEPGIPGVTVTLFNSLGQVVAMTVTGSDGSYSFKNVPLGDYKIVETQPVNFGSSNPNTLTLTLGTADRKGFDFGNTLGKLSGRVYQDFMLTGFKDAGVNSPGFPGVTITLSGTDNLGNPVSRTTVTDANGNYVFDRLPGGKYTVTEAATPGFFQGFNTAGTTGGVAGKVGDDNIRDIPLPAGGESKNNNFGELPPADPIGYVYHDLNANGRRDPGEPGIAGVPITISGIAFAGTPLERPLTAADVPGGLTRLTSADGFYQFDLIPPGIYTLVQAVQPAGFLDGLESSEDPNTSGEVIGNDRFDNIISMPNPIRGPFNFGEVLPTSLSGRVYLDNNRNGVSDAGEPGLQGVTITLSGTDFLGNPVIQTTTTAADGSFSFSNLRPGTYSLQETQPANVRQGTNAVGTRGGSIAGDLISSITLLSGATGTNYLFGEVLTEVPVNPVQTIGTTTPIPTPIVVVVGNDDINKALYLASTPNVTAASGTANATGPTRPQFANSMAAVGTSFANTPSYVTTGAGEGGAPIIRVFDFNSGREVFTIMAFDPSFTGGVRTAVGDFNGDGVADIIAGAGIGGGPQVTVFDGTTGRAIFSFMAYETSFTGGIYVASADVNGDGADDIITGTGVGGGPRIRVFSGRTGEELMNFFPYEESFRGGVTVATGDFNGDGFADIVAGTGVGGGPRVRTFDGRTGAALQDFFAYDPSVRTGVQVTAGDLNGDGIAEIITAAGQGGGPHVQVFDARTLDSLASFFAFETTFTGGVRVSARDTNGDGRDDLILGAGVGGNNRTTIRDARTGETLDEFFAFDPAFRGGVFVG